VRREVLMQLTAAFGSLGSKQAPVPDRGAKPCPPGIAAIKLSIAKTARLARLATQYATGLISQALAFALRWSQRRRRHQAIPGWHPYSARLLATTG
jgi:hypothetical protein